PYGARESWRVGFMGMIDRIWKTIESRNTTFRYQEGFVQREINAYDEKSIREAVTNAFVHRDYSVQGNSIIIKASPDKFYIENPGMFMKGVTVENIMEKSVYRNRLLAESLEKINVMERSSQGVDTIFMRAIEDGKGRPSYHVTTDPSIQLTIPAKLVDEDFVRFFEDAINKRGASLSAREIVELEMIRTGERRTDLQFKDKFIELGLIEKYGRGRGQKFILSHKYYSVSGRAGEHTRITGLSRDMRRATILQHLKNNKGVTSKELQDAMPDMKDTEISSLLKGMKKDGLIEYVGTGPRWGYWKLKA
ncbi:MAG: ATP-binding protein, partial [Candidatus Saccharimonadales bacterium]